MACYKTTDYSVIQEVKRYIQNTHNYWSAVEEMLKKIGADPNYYYIGGEPRKLYAFVFKNGVPKTGYKKRGKGYFFRKDNQNGKAMLQALPMTGDIHAIIKMIRFEPGLIQAGPRFCFSPEWFLSEDKKTFYFCVPQGMKYQPPEFVTEIQESVFEAKKKKVE